MTCWQYSVQRFLGALRDSIGTPLYALWNAGVDRYEWGWHPIKTRLLPSRIDHVTKTLCETQGLGFQRIVESQDNQDFCALEVSLVSPHAQLLVSRIAERIRQDQLELCVQVVLETMQVFASRTFQQRPTSLGSWFFAAGQPGIQIDSLFAR